ncbi:hypothetical protein [Peredibacter starrii]|uniref:CUB domain-containing protein n=1 Tax=Peredibacter starrii TaxID=28202 RepID=A0AAX4HKY4_9BACT|nr:hypothetical protein [Peredibacter starrii]WPU63904.1 hypothetical protein SOO65_14510 [Peredibacter starrii]
MKSSIVFAFVLLAFSQLTFAQAVRKCSDEVLTCELIQNYRVVKTESAAWDGFNSDEPSIEPYYCSMNLWIEQDDLVFRVNVTDDDYVANVYNVQRSNLGRALEGSAAMPVVPGKPFYFARGDKKIKCVLN